MVHGPSVLASANPLRKDRGFVRPSRKDAGRDLRGRRNGMLQVSRAKPGAQLKTFIAETEHRYRLGAELHGCELKSRFVGHHLFPFALGPIVAMINKLGSVVPSPRPPAARQLTQLVTKRREPHAGCRKPATIEPFRAVTRQIASGARMRLSVVLMLVAFAAAQPAAAQPAPPQSPPPQPPSSEQAPPQSAPGEQAPPARVGRVSYVSGNLAFHTAGDNEWSAASVNYPVATGGSFWTDPQARALIQIGPSTIGMDGGSEIDVTNLDEQVAQLGLPQGRIHLHLRQLDAGQSFEIDLPQGAVWLLQPGSYDIDAGNPSRSPRISVLAGSARFVGSGIDVAINSGDAVVLSQTSPVTAVTERAASDSFVAWCEAHDYHAPPPSAPHYVSPQMTGYAALDPYGSWSSSPQYGEVWYPSQVPADWAPYREGRWVWVQPWGWTWVDQEPWGFAPFHYGRWANIDGRWGWCPGSYVAQPVYAPALVAFVGIGAGIGAAVSAGPAVGWFPLAPGEPYWPSYTRNVNYIRNVNITSVKNINTVVIRSNGVPPAGAATARFANRRFATVVPQRVFANADPVARAVVHVPPAALQKAPVSVHPPRIRPVVAHAAVSGAPAPRHPPGAAALGPNRPAAGAPGAAPTHPGAAGGPHAPGAAPANTAALPPRERGPGRGEGPPTRPGGPAATAPGAAAPGTAARPEHPGPANTATLPPRPGATEEHPGFANPPRAPGAEPANRAALPSHPGAAGGGEAAKPGAAPAKGAVAPEHRAPAETAPPRPAPATRAALPPHPGATEPAHPGAAAPAARQPGGEAARHEPAPGAAVEHRPPAAAPEKRAPERHAPAAAARPAPHPRPEAPAPRPFVEPQAFHPASPHAASARPAAPVRQAAPPRRAAPPPRPAAPPVERAARPAPHPQQAAAAHPQPAHDRGKPAAKEKGKEGQH